MKRAAHIALRVIGALLLLAFVAMVAGCGGGDPEPESHVGPPDCKNHSEQCQ